MIDLQIHTTDSDGTWPWDKALAHCKEMGLTAYAITDHDTIDRRSEIIQWANENGENVIPGVELSTRESDETVHLLGYFLDGPLDKLQERLHFLVAGRKDRNGQIIRKLNSMGIPITEEMVREIAGKGIMGRPHIARALLNLGEVKTIVDAFDKFLAPGGAAYFPKDELPLRDAIDLLHGAGAVTSVAHPGFLRRGAEKLENSLKMWRDWGLDGVEAIYPVYTDKQTAFFDRIATKYGFLKTGGSDFHGENKPHIKIGVGTGNLNVPDEILEPLQARRVEINKAITA